MTTTRRVVLLACSLVALTLGLCSPLQAQRVPKLPLVRLNNGDKGQQPLWKEVRCLERYDKVPRELAIKVMGIQGTTEVAFSYELYQLFGWSLWTRNGHHILLVDGRRHVQPTEDQWRALIGDLPTSKFGKPIWYHLPTLPIIVGVFVTYKVARRFVFQTEAEKLKALKQDARYQQAMETLFGSKEGEQTLTTRLDDLRYTTAKNVLVDQGVQPSKVEANLQLLVRAELKENNRRIAQEFQTGEALEARGKWDDCVELYIELLEIIPLDDDRRPNAEERLDVALGKVAESRAASSIHSSNATNKDDDAVGTKVFCHNRPRHDE